MSKLRPTSPHLSIYKLPAVSVFSITHRITGLYIFIYMIAVIAVWFMKPNATIMESSLFINIILFCTTVFNFALAFHISAGIRYLLWGIGFGVNLSFVQSSTRPLIFAMLFLGCLSSYFLFKATQL
jgi:succinate dehydrogenase / fumarate reductase cytochrome b subunit